MNKKFMPIFFVFVAVLLVYAVMPDFKESMKPVNRIISQAEDAGAAIIVQFVETDAERAAAQNAMNAFLQNPPAKVIAGVVDADESRDFMRTHNVPAPGYIVMDSHANPVHVSGGIASESSLRLAAAGLHTH